MTRPVRDHRQPTVVSVQLLLYAILDVVSHTTDDRSCFWFLRALKGPKWQQMARKGSFFFLSLQIEIAQTFVPYVWIVTVAFTWTFHSVGTNPTLNDMLLLIHLFICRAGRISTSDGIQMIFAASGRFRFLLRFCGNQI